MQKSEILKITNIEKAKDIFFIKGEIDFDLVKCITSQTVILKRKNPPDFIIKLFKEGNYKNKKVIVDTTKCKYSFIEVNDYNEEYFLPCSLSGKIEFVKLYKSGEW